MIEIVTPHDLAEAFGPQIAAAAAGRARLLRGRGGDPVDPDVSGAEIAVRGHLARRGAFAEIIAAMPRLRWIHSVNAGINDFVSPELRAHL